MMILGIRNDPFLVTECSCFNSCSWDKSLKWLIYEKKKKSSLNIYSHPDVKVVQLGFNFVQKTFVVPGDFFFFLSVFGGFFPSPFSIFVPLHVFHNTSVVHLVLCECEMCRVQSLTHSSQWFRYSAVCFSSYMARHFGHWSSDVLDAAIWAFSRLELESGGLFRNSGSTVSGCLRLAFFKIGMILRVGAASLEFWIINE